MRQHYFRIESRIREPLGISLRPFPFIQDKLAPKLCGNSQRLIDFNNSLRV